MKGKYRILEKYGKYKIEYLDEVLLWCDVTQVVIAFDFGEEINQTILFDSILDAKMYIKNLRGEADHWKVVYE